MKFIIKIIEIYAILGSNCVSLCFTYQPQVPKSLRNNEK